MFGTDDLAEFFRNPEEIMRNYHEQLAKSEELQRQMMETSVTLESEDERVRVSFSEQGGLELTLDPRALRMASEDLAAEIQRLVNTARSDVQTRNQELSREAFADGAPDPQETVEAIPELQRTMDEMMRDTNLMGQEVEEFAERVKRMFPT